MVCHRVVFCILVLSELLCSRAFATISFLSYSGYSNIIQTQIAQPQPLPSASPGAPTTTLPPPQFYYSNISSTIQQIPAGTGLNYYVDAQTAGAGTCSKALNGNCKNPSDVFSITVSDNATTTVAPGTPGAPGTPTGPTYMYWVYTGQNAPLAGTSILGLPQIATQQLYTPGYPVTFQATWANICNKVVNSGQQGVPVNLGADCRNGNGGVTPDPVIVTFYIIADNNGMGTVGTEIQPFTVTFASAIPANSVAANQLGLYGFMTYPGDQKAYLQGIPGIGGIQTDTDFPTQTAEHGAQIQSIRMIYDAFPNNGTYDVNANYNAANFAGVLPTNVPLPGHSDIGVNPDGTLQGSEITGLTDGLVYYFRAGMVDYAGNLGYITDAADDAATCNLSTGTVPCHVAIPDQVVGMLASNHCFIATAAWGSIMAPQVKLLRQFRDRYLLPHAWGRAFVRWYYRNSPPWADRLARHDDVRAVVRAGLYPLVAFSYVSLKIGAFNACLLFATLLLLPFLIFRFKTTPRPGEGGS